MQNIKRARIYNTPMYVPIKIKNPSFSIFK